MLESSSRHPLRSKGLPVALACALAACLGGCSTVATPAVFGAQQADCRSTAAWPTQVFGSLQRTENGVPTEPVSAYRSRPPRKYSSKKHATGESFEEAPDQGFEPTVKVTSEPATKEGSEPAAESKPWSVSEHKPEAVGENGSVSKPATETSPSAEPVVPAEAPEQEAAKPEPQQEVAPPQPPVVPPRAPPSPEVVAVCGAGETACQDQLTALLADPLHKWINEKPTPQEDATGVRTLAYRVLTPVLACDDLRKGLRETVAAPAQSETAQPDSTLAAVQLLRRSVNLELKAEIAKRC